MWGWALLSIPLFIIPSIAAADKLPIRDGEYGEKAWPCGKSETIMRFRNGERVFPPYEGNCTTNIQQKSAHVFEWTRACEGNKPLIMRITVLSETEYERSNNGIQVVMRWCKH
jgi:hypothetical protein